MDFITKLPKSRDPVTEVTYDAIMGNPSSYNLVQGPSLLIICLFCHKSWDSVAIPLQTSQLPRVKTHHF